MCRVFLLFLTLSFFSCGKDLDEEKIISIFGNISGPISEKVSLAQSYSYYDATRRTSYFREDFSNNSNRWPLSPPLTNISSGIFNSNGRGALLTLSKPIDESKDFEVEIIIGFKKHPNVPFNAVIWNYNASSRVSWGIFNLPLSSGSQEHKIFCGQFSAAENLYLSASKSEMVYNSSNISWAKVTMRKVDNFLVTFIDEIRYSTIKYRPTGGGLLGINDPGGIQIDRISIDYLK